MRYSVACCMYRSSGPGEALRDSGQLLRSCIYGFGEFPRKTVHLPAKQPSLRREKIVRYQNRGGQGNAAPGSDSGPFSLFYFIHFEGRLACTRTGTIQSSMDLLLLEIRLVTGALPLTRSGWMEHCH